MSPSLDELSFSRRYHPVMDDPEQQLHIPSRLMSRAGIRGWLIPLGLILVLFSNVVALFLPFLDIEVVLKGSSEYKLPESVKLMWETGLYWVAILIAGFSLVFPFVKLLSLFTLWFFPMRVSTRGRGLRILGSLGRWSLLDVFVALVLIVLAHEQGSLFVTDVKPGLYLFLLAILMAMSTGEFMAVLHERTENLPELSDTKTKRPSVGSGWRRNCRSKRYC